MNEEKQDALLTATKALQLREHIKTDERESTVYLNPLNEGHELAYMEKFTGTPLQIVNRCRKICDVLDNNLKNGTWSVQVEAANLDGSFCGQQTVRIDLDRVTDSEGNVLADISVLGGLDL